MVIITYNNSPPAQLLNTNTTTVRSSFFLIIHGLSQIITPILFFSPFTYILRRTLKSYHISRPTLPRCSYVLGISLQFQLQIHTLRNHNYPDIPNPKDYDVYIYIYIPYLEIYDFVYINISKKIPNVLVIY